MVEEPGTGADSDSDLPPLLQLSSVRHSYREGNRERNVLDGIDLRMARGEIVALLGRSGCGKSTLLNLISGIEPLQSGDIRIDAIEPGRLDEAGRSRFRRRHIGFIYQSFQLFPTLTVSENIGLVLELNGFSREHTRERVQQLLVQMRLADRRDDYPDKLSGGEQQRVAICRAIAHRPTLILADEPTGNLDSAHGQEVMEMLQSLNDEGTTIVMVTHSPSHADYARRTINLFDGHVVTENLRAVV